MKKIDATQTISTLTLSIPSMNDLFNFDRFVELGFSVSTHLDSWGNVHTKYNFTRNDIEFTLTKRDGSDFVMGVCITKSKWENHIVSENEALRWFQRTFPDVVL
jgi:hypothetical protein